MPQALHDKLKKQYGEKSKIPYKIMAKMEKHGNGVAGMMRRKK